MPANLSPEYKSAEAAYRSARDPEERLGHLREMLRTIPKHKGTEHLQADIKSRIKELTDDLSGPKKGAARGPSVAVRPEGAAQIALLGPPNAGKSSLHVRLTGSQAEVGPYPFTTKLPLPGMLAHEDVQFQLVDLPPVSASFMETWMPNALVHAEGALLVVDLADPAALEDVPAIVSRLGEKRVKLLGSGAAPADDDEVPDPFGRRLPTLLVAARVDRIDVDAAAEIDTFRELTGAPFRALGVSVETGVGIDRIGPALMDLLGIVRVYGKTPGHPPDMSRPFTLRRGETVQDVARMVHRGLSDQVRSARVWGSGSFAGQLVSRDHVVADRDVVELHF